MLNQDDKDYISNKNLEGLLSILPNKDDKAFAASSLSEFKKIQKRAGRRSINIIWRSVGFAAASLALAFGIWSMVGEEETFSHISEYTTSSDGNTIVAQYNPAFEEITTGPGETRIITLSDKTQIWVNANTSLKYPKHFDSRERRIELIEGEAFFEVAHNKEVPFIVTSKGYDIKVLGTKFNVLAYKEQEFKTSLVEGSVKIYASNNESQAIMMKPNETVELIGGILVSESINNSDELEWRKGLYIFNDTSLEYIVDKFSDYYGVEIEIDNTEIALHRFSGKFRHGDGVEGALKAMQMAYPFNYQYNKAKRKYIITK